jgi:glutamyl-tRNA synthetase
MSIYVQLANLIFENINETLSDLEKLYPPRSLDKLAEVTRFAPSPTGFLHTGSLFTALVAHKIAKDTNGVFYLRLEDTDTKREIEGSGEELIQQLKIFKINIDEGYLEDEDLGKYGPYRQSQRAHIYHIVIKYLLENNLAYPCFCSTEELDTLRKTQEKQKVVTGYYGKYAKCRYLSAEEAIKKIKSGQPYVIRYRSHGNHERKITLSDVIRGDITIAENDLDIVILKADLLPTYHFAHVVDDYFMRTTLVIRGEEWISSLPIHIELFNALKWSAPKYAHLPLIMKLVDGHKHKLSKRRDQEAAVTYFIEDGYPVEALNVYLMSIANSSFEQWTVDHNSYEIEDFPFDIKKMSLDGALFDIDKLNYFAKEIIARLKANELATRSKRWAVNYSPELLELINRDFIYYENILNIEREKEKPRKDIAKFNDIYRQIRFFYHDLYLELISEILPFNETIKKETIISFLTLFIKKNDYSLNNSDWFNALKEIASQVGFASSAKIYKNNKEEYVGHVGDAAEILRISLTSSKNAPNLWDILQLLKKEEVDKRLNLIIKKLSE